MRQNDDSNNRSKLFLITVYTDTIKRRDLRLPQRALVDREIFSLFP